MTHKIFRLLIEVEDHSEAEGDDVELWIDNALQHGLPRDLTATIVSFEEIEDEN